MTSPGCDMVPPISGDIETRKRLVRHGQRCAAASRRNCEARHPSERTPVAPSMAPPVNRNTTSLSPGAPPVATPKAPPDRAPSEQLGPLEHHAIQRDCDNVGIPRSRPNVGRRGEEERIGRCCNTSPCRIRRNASVTLPMAASTAFPQRKVTLSKQSAMACSPSSALLAVVSESQYLQRVSCGRPQPWPQDPVWLRQQSQVVCF